MSYIRVAPRDLFNEANFMKCIAQISLLLHDSPIKDVKLWLDIWETNGVRFVQTIDGELFEATIRLRIKNNSYILFRPLNSRETYPVYIIDDATYEQYTILTNAGTFSEEFLEFIK